MNSHLSSFSNYSLMVFMLKYSKNDTSWCTISVVLDLITSLISLQILPEKLFVVNEYGKFFSPRNIPLDFTARGVFSFLGFLVMYFYVRLKLIWVYCWASLIESSCFIKLSNLYTREQSLHRQWFIVFVASRFLNEINSWYPPSTNWVLRKI